MRKIIIILFSISSAIFAQTAGRIENSPYPVSTKPDTLYKVLDNAFYAGQILSIGTMQGILAKTKPRIYRVNSQSYINWLDDLENNYGVTVLDIYAADFEGLIKHFKDEMDGFILCSTVSNSVSVAISLSGILNAVAVTNDNKAFFESIGIPMLIDVRDKDEEWFFDNYASQINKDIFCFQKETNLQFLADYAAYGNMISFYHNMFTNLTEGNLPTNCVEFQCLI